MKDARRFVACVVVVAALLAACAARPLAVTSPSALASGGDPRLTLESDEESTPWKLLEVDDDGLGMTIVGATAGEFDDCGFRRLIVDESVEDEIFVAFVVDNTGAGRVIGSDGQDLGAAFCKTLLRAQVAHASFGRPLGERRIVHAPTSPRWGENLDGFPDGVEWYRPRASSSHSSAPRDHPEDAD